jgi:hypothetical protein
MNRSPEISAEEVARVMRSAIAGDVQIYLFDKEQRWDESFCCDVKFIIGELKLTFYRDCDLLDYTGYAESIDGRCTEFSEWNTDAIDCPLDLLTDNERYDFEQLLGDAE